MLRSDGRPRRTATFVEKDCGEEYLFYDEGGDRVHVLNGTAREIYLLCDGTRSVEQLVEAITESYDVDRTTADGDVRETVGRLESLGLLRFS